MRLCSVIFGGLAVLAAAACGSSDCGSTSPLICHANRSTANEVAGAWAQVTPTNGSTLIAQLTARDTTLSGAGTFTTVAGVATPVDVRGFVFWRDSFFAPSGHEIPAEPIMVLDFISGPQLLAHLNQAVLQDQNTLFGGVVYSDNASATYAITFRHPAVALSAHASH